jgi:hypothetical protein
MRHRIHTRRNLFTAAAILVGRFFNCCLVTSRGNATCLSSFVDRCPLKMHSLVISHADAERYYDSMAVMQFATDSHLFYICPII